MLFSVLQLAHITPYHVHFLGMALWPLSDLVGITPSASRLAVMLKHARPRFAEVLKRSAWLEDTIALLFSLSY